MAMIKCPECQSDVSDHASACPRCGFPISSLRTNNIIKIKTPSPNGSALGQFKIIDMDTEQELLRVAQGGLVQLHSQRPLNIGITWGISSKPAKSCCFTVYPGKKYSVSWTMGWLMPGLVCSEVDLFDSDS